MATSLSATDPPIASPSPNNSLSTTTTSPPNNILLPKPAPPTKPSLLTLPLELRLKIYTYLLPSRHHTITSQTKTTTSPPLSHTARPHNTHVQPRFLSANFRRNYPYASIYTAILRANKQILSEAEPVLYGGLGTVFDFGVRGVDVLIRFFAGRSKRARGAVREVGLGKEVANGVDGDEMWMDVCGYVSRELIGLRVLDVKLWDEGGGVDGFPVALGEARMFGKVVCNVEGLEVEVLEGCGEVGSLEWGEMRMRMGSKWREFEVLKVLLCIESLVAAKITWWGFLGIEGIGGNARREGGGSGNRGFDSWLAARMVDDIAVRDRMVKEGLVVEGVVTLRNAK